MTTAHNAHISVCVVNPNRMAFAVKPAILDIHPVIARTANNLVRRSEFLKSSKLSILRMPLSFSLFCPSMMTFLYIGKDIIYIISLIVFILKNKRYIRF